jgi:hypothetical protein
MCRWNAYVGEPLVIGELLYRTKHGLIDESLHSRMSGAWLEVPESTALVVANGVVEQRPFEPR